MKISVVIATVNRKDELRETILAYQQQTHKDIEIIIIDNGSTDGTREMMIREFSNVFYEWLPYNMGTHAINIGLMRASGAIYWLSNNDSYPEDSTAFEQIIHIFADHPHVHIIGTEDIEVLSGNMVYEWHPLTVDKKAMPPDGFETNLFHGTGAAIRREVVDEIGGVWDMFLYEELDFCTRAIIAGFNVRYFPSIRTLHFASPKERDTQERWLMALKQMMRYNWRYLPFLKAMRRTLISWCIFMMDGVVRRVRPSIFFEGIFGVMGVILSTYRKERRVAPAEKVAKILRGHERLLRAFFGHYKGAIHRKIARRSGA